MPSQTFHCCLPCPVVQHAIGMKQIHQDQVNGKIVVSTVELFQGADANFMNALEELLVEGGSYIAALCEQGLQSWCCWVMSRICTAVALGGTLGWVLD